MDDTSYHISHTAYDVAPSGQTHEAKVHLELIEALESIRAVLSIAQVASVGEGSAAAFRLIQKILDKVPRMDRQTAETRASAVTHWPPIVEDGVIVPHDNE